MVEFLRNVFKSCFKVVDTFQNTEAMPVTQKTLADLNQAATSLDLLANKNIGSDTSVLARALEIVCKALIEIGQPPQANYPKSLVTPSPRP